MLPTVNHASQSHIPCTPFISTIQGLAKINGEIYQMPSNG